ncbi:hypothetical protein [Egicoccus sp. AB-alg2]|uniref:hypothetical protein n=1 Tax=Egicoccus sp. AB-alg2 TaxID=3242693 RepID=UPI00359E0F53
MYALVDVWEGGVTGDPLFEVSADRYREEFLVALEAARALHDPATEWELFRDTLWDHLSRVFGVEIQEGWPEGLPDHEHVPVGDARAVAGWLRQRDEDFQRSAAIPRGCI